MSVLYESSGTLCVTRCWCGIQHAVPQSLREEMLRNRTIEAYCPLGHRYVVKGPSEDKAKIEQLERQLSTAQRREKRLESELKSTENSRRAEKAAKTRLKNRVAAGVCPCCNRTFQNLAAHMKGQHPGFVAEDGDGGAA